MGEISDFVDQSCRSVIGKTGRLLEVSSTYKITCYKRYPDMAPLDKADGDNFHVAAQGESKTSEKIIPTSAVGDIKSIWAVTVDGISPGWFGITQPTVTPEATSPCKDEEVPGGEAVIHPCSAGLNGKRWIWILVAPAGNRKDCVDPPRRTIRNLERFSPDMYTTHVQSFCSNVPDGFICPITCQADKAPTGAMRCKNGRWQRSLRCRPKRKVCLTPFKTATITTPNALTLWQIDGVVPDKRNRCDLFSRQGKKCKGTCSEGLPQTFATGQVHCKRGVTDDSLAATGFWQARPNFACNEPFTDSMYPRPVINFLTRTDGDQTTIRVTATIPRQANRVRSMLTKIIFRELRNRMRGDTVTAIQEAFEQAGEADTPEEPEEERRLMWSAVDGGDHPSMPRWWQPRRAQSIDDCEEGPFVQQDSCLDGGEFGACWNCLATQVETRTQCWRGRSAPPGSPTGHQCDGTDQIGDYYTCRWTEFTEPQTCYARAPDGYCVKKICAYQGGTKSCTEYEPPIYLDFCIGNPDLPIIDHAVIEYTCCNHDALTFVGYVSGGNPAHIGSYEIQVGARNNAGTSWSLPTPLTCAALIATAIYGADAPKYEIEPACAALLPGQNCRVLCAANYFLEEVFASTNGVYTCGFGLGESLVGDAPRCLLRPGGNQNPTVGNGPPSGPNDPPPANIPAKCQECAQINGWNRNNFELCQLWGDPHVKKSWRSNRRFDHQGTGVYRYATAGTCAGGDFEVQLFQCQFKSGGNAVAIGVAVRMNNGNTVFVNKRDIESTGQPWVEPSDMIQLDSQGVNIYSDDQCAFVNVNVKTFSRNPGHMHNVKILVFNEDLTSEGVCGAPTLGDEYIQPTSTQNGGKMIFTSQQHTDLCNQCINSGSAAPAGCLGGTPPEVSTGCSFMRPLRPESEDQECLPVHDSKITTLQTFRGSANCIVYTKLRKRKSCFEFCGERGSECVAFIDDKKHDCRPKNTQAISCTTKTYNDGLCVCKIPANPVPGDDATAACANSDITLAQAEQFCKTDNPDLANAVYPPRSEEQQQLTEAEIEMDDSLKDCMIDCCSADAADRDDIVDNAGNENVPDQAGRGCQKTDGLEYEIGNEPYPCMCVRAECRPGQACKVVHIGNKDVGSCAPVPTTTTVTDSTTSVTETTETQTTSTKSETTRTFTVSTSTSTKTTLTSTSMTISTTTLSSTTTMTSVTTTSFTSSTTVTRTTTSITVTSTTETSTTSSTRSSSSATTTSTISTTSSTITSTSSISSSTSTTSVTSTTSASSTSTTSTVTASTTTTSTLSRTITTSTITTLTQTWTGTSITSTSTTKTTTTITSITTTSTSASVTTSTSTSMTSSSTSATETSATATSTSVSASSTTSSTGTSTTTTTTEFQFRANHCGHWVGNGGFIDFPLESNDDYSTSGLYQWRVYYAKHPREENELFSVEFCQDITLTKCQIYCLAAGVSYFIRVELVIILNNYPVLVSLAREQIVPVPLTRADRPEDLRVVTAGDHTLEIAWTPAMEQGNCSFRSWKVEIHSNPGGWTENPGCTGLTDFGLTTCTLSNLPCDTGFNIQVGQICVNEESNSDWSRPTLAETLATIGGVCGTPADPPTPNDAETIEDEDEQGDDDNRRLNVQSRRLNTVVCPTTNYQLRLTWVAGTQQDAQFLVWYIELYKLSIVAGIIDPNGNVLIPGVCQGILDRATTTCLVPGLAWGLYAFAVQEVSLTPETSSALSELSNPTWVPRWKALAPLAVTLTEPTVSGLKVHWINQDLKDCPFHRTKVELSAGNDVWFEPDACLLITAFTTTSCTIASGLQSNTGYVARVSVLCDECTNTPTSFRTVCTGQELAADVCQDLGTGGCYKKLDAFRANSCYSESSPQVFTIPRRQAPPTQPTVIVPTDSGVRVTLSWTGGQGSASDANIASDCTSQSFQLEIKLQSQADWGTPEGCQSLGSSASCTATNLQCNTAYDARVRASCVPTAASSDWTAFTRFSTANVGTCLRPASAPQLLRATSTATTALEVSFTAGAAGDCVFGGFELQRSLNGIDNWIASPSTCGSLSVRAGPSCLVTGLLEDTAYFFRARELCNNGAPLNSPWGNTEEPLRTNAVPPVGQPLTIDPIGSITGLLAPQRLMLFFGTDLDLGDLSVELSICPSLVGTTETPGACNCVSTADCTSNCVSRSQVSVLLLSARVLLVDFSTPLPKPLTSCPYAVAVEAGFLKTQLTPSKLSERFAWTFSYTPLTPIGSASLHSSTTTSLTMHVFWDTPMTVTCGVRDGSGGLAQVSAPEDFTGAREFVEVRITGLVPFTQYSVVCTGSAIGDSILTASVTADGVSTERDTDDTVRSITLNIQALCSDDTVTPVVGALYPPFDPSIRTYQVTLNADEMQTWCGDSETQAVLRLEVSAETSSAFASSTLPEAQSMVQQLVDSNGQLPAGVATSTTLQLTINVIPAQPGDTEPLPYRITCVLGTLNLQLESSNLGSSVISFDGSSSATLSLSVPATLTADSIGMRIGTFEQALTLVSSVPVPDTSPARNLLTFEVASVLMMGSELPVVITVRPPVGSGHPTLDVATDVTVSSDPPIFSGFETNHPNGLVSLTQPTTITITGENLVQSLPGGTSNIPEIYVVEIPLDCTTEECHQQTLADMLNDGIPGLCSNTVVTDETRISCIMPATGAGNVGLCLLIRNGLFAEFLCSPAGIAPPDTVVIEVPGVGGLSQPQQGMSGSTPFTVTVDGALPDDTVSQGFLQVWASPFNFTSNNPSNPGNGFIPLCADAVVDGNDITCWRNQDFNISQIGRNPNVFVQTGQNQVSPLIPGALEILNPIITSIERSHEFEVGPLQLIITGENFGTRDNGNMVCSLQSLGPATQTVSDIRLAELLGDPSYTINCEVGSHTDTQVICNCIQDGNQQSVLGSQVDSVYYDEQIPTSGDGRRLQQLNIDTLALQLSPLPVAISVTYQLECEVLERLNESCDPNVKPTSIDIPEVRQWQSVRLRPCPAGEHRINYTDPSCLQCQPGKYKSGVGPALSCSFCDYGFYMGLFGAGACTSCPPRETTLIQGATQILSCDCSPGFFRLRTNSSEDWALAINHGVCQPCPVGAICEGTDIMPYSAPGYWTPDRLTFWPCFPAHACLQGNADDPNLCEPGREPTGRRCGQCARKSFAHQSECYICSTVDDLVAWSGLLLWPVFVVSVFVPIVLRQIRSNDMSRTKKQKRLMKHDGSWYGALGLVDHGEFRMMMIMWTCLQMLWICSLMPLEFNSFARTWLWALGMFVFDLSIFRPQCAWLFTYFWKWLVQWGVFFLMILILLGVMLIIGRNHKNARHDWKFISRKQALWSMFSASLLLITLVHLRDDLIFAQCIACEDGKFCLAEQPVIYCDFDDREWITMAVLSVLDICLVIGATIPILAMSIFKSWKWQHGDEVALSSDFLAPWYVYVSEMLVERHSGYIKEVREAVPEFEQAYKDLHSDAMRQEVWSKAIDIILAQEAERAEVLLRRIIRHLYNHNPRFKIIDEDEGPTFTLVKAILRSDEEDMEDEARENNKETHHHDDPVATLKAADIHHVTSVLNNLVDTARFTIPGVRLIKRWLGYSWSLVLLFIRFSILTFAMLMRRDEVGSVPLAYMITKLLSLVLEAALAPYQWNYLNDWELVVHSLVYVFMMFVVSGWSDLVSNILLVGATLAAVMPVILRMIFLLNIKDKSQLQDPSGISVKQGEVSYHIGDLAAHTGTRSLGISTTTTDSYIHSGTLEHVRKSIEMVKKKIQTVVERTVDGDGTPIERTIVTEEVHTDAMTYSLDMTKSQVGRMMKGMPEDEPPAGEPLEDIVEFDVDESVGSEVLSSNELQQDTL